VDHGPDQPKAGEVRAMTFTRCAVKVLYHGILERLPLRLSIELIRRYGKFKDPKPNEEAAKAHYEFVIEKLGITEEQFRTLTKKRLLKLIEEKLRAYMKEHPEYVVPEEG